MPLKAIYLKEWLKLRWCLPVLVLVHLGAAAWFWFTLDFEFHSIEPESMLWYRFAQIGDKPYLDITALFLLCAIVIALCQFLPEAIRNRARILTHLPVPLARLVSHHLLAGAAALLLLNGLLALAVALIMALYYPPEIVAVGVKDCLFRLLPALACYFGLSSAIIERTPAKKAFKLLIAVAATLLCLKTRIAFSDLWVAAAAIWLAWSVGDSFLSIKAQSLRNPAYLAGAAALCLIIPAVGTLRYQQEFARDFDRRYIFYSPLLNTFVYQENGKGHQFTYGTDETTFDRERYEQALPFVIWRNLEIQGNLPVVIDGEVFDRDRIRDARLSLNYHPADRRPVEVHLYPLFNPLSHRGMIPFPEEAFALKSDRIVVYGSENRLNPELTAEINDLLANAGVRFPLTGIWGRTTNMKPFDWGYFLKDAKGALFNLRRADDRLSVVAIELPAQLPEIVHMQMTENRQMNFYGYAVTADSQVHLVAYPDYRFIPLDLDGFDHARMRFQLLADPLYYLVRYDDRREDYRAVLFDRDYQRLKAADFR